ncbi:MAG: ankyrin repeat domain-containing protein [Desulfobacteraceae bacterium]|nr:ankyrin repeat domain-containing protein [Desulfobacteraceae bacterium]
MAFDPAQFSNSNNVYQSGQNGNDNRTNQNNQPAENLQPSNKNHTPKANVRNNANGPELSVSPIKKLTQFVKSKKLAKKTERQNERKAYSQDDKNLKLFKYVSKGNAKWVKKWIDAGADVNGGMYEVEKRVKRLWLIGGYTDTWKHSHYSVRFESKRVNNRTKVIRSYRAHTPLNWAAWEGYTDVVKSLLSRPETDVNDDNPLWWAAWEGHTDVVKLLLSHPDIKVNRGALSRAIKNRHADIVKLLLSHPDIELNEGAREYLDRLVDKNDMDSIQEIVLKGCSKEVYKHLRNKAIEARKPKLIQWLKHKQDCLVSGYANTEALGGHNKAYGKTKVPEGLLKTVENYLNPNLIERQK